MGARILATWIITDADTGKSQFPQIGTIPSSDPKLHAVYWRCVTTFFACAYRVRDPGLRLVLFSNQIGPPPFVGRLLDRFGVEFIQVPLQHLPPDGYYGRWRNQFYILDLIQYLAAEAFESCVILDSDCIVNQEISEIYASIEQYGALTYCYEYPSGSVINGLTREQLRLLYQAMVGAPLDREPYYYGGEFFGVSSRVVRILAAEGEATWQECLRRFHLQQPKFNEEGHLLSYLYWKLGLAHNTAAPFVKRLWTQAQCRNLNDRDSCLPIWHVPAEKKYGLRSLYQAVLDDHSWFWRAEPGDEWRARIGRLLGIPRLSYGKRIGDFTRKGLLHLHWTDL